MGAPVASGTLAGSTSGSWASNHEERRAATTVRACVDTRRVVGLAQLCRRSRSRTSSPGTISGTARGSSSRSASSAMRDSSVREAQRRDPAVVCQQPPVVGSTQFGGRRRSRPRGSARPSEPWQTRRRARASLPSKAIISCLHVVADRAARAGRRDSHASGDKHVAGARGADTCVRARAGIHRSRRRVAAYVQKGLS
jgi:hypothetical protein